MIKMDRKQGEVCFLYNKGGATGNMGKIALNYIYLSENHAGGKDQVALNLLRGFKENEQLDKMIIICLDYSYELLKSMAPEAKFITIAGSHGKSELSRLWHIMYINSFVLPKIIRQHDISLVFHASCTNGLFKYKVPSVVIPHDIKAVSHRVIGDVKIPYFKYFLYRIMYRMDFTHSDRIIAISDYDKAEISRFYPAFAEKVKKIYNPIRIEEESYHGHTGTNRHIVALNIQFHHKNTITLIKAFERIKEQIDSDLILIGNVPERMKYLMDYVDEHRLGDRVRFTGFLSGEEKRMLLEDCQLYVNPSLFEGFGMTAVESMILKVPTLLSDVSANREVTHGMCCYYSPANDEKELGKAILSCLNTTYAQEKLDEISETMSAIYDYRMIANDYMNLFDEMLRK